MKKIITTTTLAAALLLSGCGTPPPQTTAVYMLLDTSGTYTQELEKAQKIINYLLMSLDSGDSIAVARIDSGSFSEKDILGKTTFDARPSATNMQKRAFKEVMDNFITHTPKGSSHTDISGAMLQAVEFLNETGAGHKYILIFSDLEEELAKGHKRDFELPLQQVNVAALNVTKLRKDNINPQEYLDRLNHWEKKVRDSGGDWKVINDLEKLDKLLTEG